MGSLVAAYSVAWTVLMVYVLTLAARQRRLDRRLAALVAADEGALGAGRRSGSHAR